MKTRRILLIIAITTFVVSSLSLVTNESYAYWASSLGIGLNSSQNSVTIDSWPQSTAISTAQEFYDFATSSTSVSTDYYHLTNDIDFGSFTWTYNSTLNSNVFRGNFDGRGYTLSNITVSSTDTASTFISLFSAMDGATIQNVKVDNYKMGFTTSFFNTAAIQAGVFASQVTGTGNLIENVTLSNVEVIANTLNGAGGLVAQIEANASMDIRNIKATNVTVLNFSKRAGGLVSRIIKGTGTVNFEDIDFQGFVASGNRTSNTGGILGTSQETITNISRVIVEYTAEGTVNLSDGTITYKSERYTGGYVGNNNNSIGVNITDAFYTGTLYTTSGYIGAAVGREKFPSTVLTNVFYSNVLFNTTNTAPTTTTGIHGTVVNASSLPSLAWWNGFATPFYSANSLWTQDASGRLELIR